MKHLIKVFAFIIFFSSTLAVAQGAEDVEKKVEKVEKAEKIQKMDNNKKAYKTDRKHLVTKETAEQKIAAMDTDKDGKISVDEASNSDNKKYSEHFAKIDTNSDGFIDLTELKAKMGKKKDKMKSKKDKKAAY